MEDTNHQESDIDLDNDEFDLEEHLRKTVEFNEDTLEKLKQNDPAITSIFLQLKCDDDGKCFFNSIDWKVDGGSISNNTHLESVVIEYSDVSKKYTLGQEGHNLPTRQQLQDFFSCIYRNCSIKDIRFRSIGINDEFGGSLIEGLCDHQSLVLLDIMNGRLSKACSVVKKVLNRILPKRGNTKSIGCEALRKISRHPQSKLKELSLTQNELNDDEMRLLCDALLGNSTIKKLGLESNIHITSVGWQALSTVIRHPDCKLVDLQLSKNSITNEGLDVLGSAFSSSSVKILDLSSNKSISSTGWNAFFNNLGRLSMEKLNLVSNNIDDTALAALTNLCGNMKSLVLSDNQSITSSGWRSFFDSLRLREAKLEKLDISGNKIGNDGTTVLGNLICSMGTSLKELHMNFMMYVEGQSTGNSSEYITSQGWVSLFTTLQHSNLALAKLNLGLNSIDDDGLQLLTRVVSSMGSSLKFLFMADNHSITPAGWLVLSDFLQSPNFALEYLILDDNNLIDGTLIAYANALVDNKTLKRLSLKNCYYEDEEEESNDIFMTERGWSAVSTLVCNKSSIMDTYNSNHTLQELHDPFSDFLQSQIQNDMVDLPDEANEMNLPDDLVLHLALNENEDKVEVARQKILQTHFPTEDNDTSNIQEFLDMELEMMPAAIAWMGRPTHDDCGMGPRAFGKPVWNDASVSGLSTMFNLMRRLPDLFDSDIHTKKKPSTGKRKRDVLQF